MRQLSAVFFIAALVLFVFVGPQPSVAQVACPQGTLPIVIVSRDAGGTLIPGLNYIIYRQLSDPDGNPYLGGTLAGGTTDAGGQSAVCVASSQSPYAVKFYEYSADYGTNIFWQSSLVPYLDGYLAEVRASYLRVIIRDAEGALVKNIKFDVYVQSYDVDGSPIVDETKLNQSKLVSSAYNTGAVGAIRAYLGAGTYVLRIHGTGDTYFYLWEQRVYAGQATELEYKLATLRVILEDGFGQVLKERTFGIYNQAYDVRSMAILGSVVADGLSVGTTGKYDAYVPAGKYALKIPGSVTGAYYTSMEVTVRGQQLTTRTYRLSGMRLIIRDEAGDLARNAVFSVAAQTKDALGQPVTGTVVYASTTADVGYGDVYLTPGAYVFIYGTNRVYNLDVSANQFTTVDWPRRFTLRPTSEVSLSSPLGNRNLTLRAVRMPTIRGLTAYKTALSRAYQVDASSITKAYNISFTYTRAALEAKRSRASKVKIAFYDPGRRTWRYVGRNVATRLSASAVMGQRGTFVLVVQK